MKKLKHEGPKTGLIPQSAGKVRVFVSAVVLASGLATLPAVAKADNPSKKDCRLAYGKNETIMVKTGCRIEKILCGWLEFNPMDVISIDDKNVTLRSGVGGIEIITILNYNEEKVFAAPVDCFYPQMKAEKTQTPGTAKITATIPKACKPLSLTCASIPQSKVSKLMEMVKDPDEEIRFNAAEDLAKIEDPKAIPTLKPFLQDKNWRVRVAATRALTNIYEAKENASIKKLAPIFIAMLDDPIPLVRGTAAQALGRINDLGSISALIKASKDDDWQVRMLATDSLGRFGTPEALSAVKSALKDDNQNVRMAAEMWMKIKGPENKE